MAREFPKSQISEIPVANEIAPPTEAFQRLQAGGFADWRLFVERHGRTAHFVFAGPA